jgi:hypothetical protein
MRSILDIWNADTVGRDNDLEQSCPSLLDLNSPLLASCKSDMRSLTACLRGQLPVLWAEYFLEELHGHRRIPQFVQQFLLLTVTTGPGIHSVAALYPLPTPLLCKYI